MFYNNCYHATADLAHLLHLQILRPINVIKGELNPENNTA